MSHTLTSFSVCAADCLALVERSPAAVAAKDRAAWVALFARYSVLEDPVGSAPQINGIFDRRAGYRGPAVLGRFFDTFIAPNTITFHVERDVVCGLHVVRDLTIEIVMAPEVVVQVPVHLLYELIVEDDALKILRLAAHWEFWPMVRQQASSGRSFAKVGRASAARLWQHMGITGIAGYMRALSCVGAPGKERIGKFAEYFNKADVLALTRLCLRDDFKIAFPYAEAPLSIAACVGQGGELRFSKLLAAGNVVSATVDYQRADNAYKGVALFELERRGLRIVALSFYWGQSV